MPIQIPSYIQGQDLNTYRVLLSIAQFCNSLEATVRDLNNHVATGGAAKAAVTLTPEALSQIEKALEAAGSNPLNVDSLTGVLLDPQGAGIPTALALPDINTVGPGAAYFVGGVLYIANKTVVPNVWTAITTSTSPQANHFVLIGPTAGGPLTPTYRALVTSDLPGTPTGTGSIVLDTAPTIINVNLSTGVAADGSGLKHQSVTTGSIALSATVDVTLTWASAFADASYTPVVSLLDASNKLTLVGIKSFNGAGVTVTVTNTDAGAAHTGTLEVFAAHN